MFLITGGAGFIGFHLTKKIIKNSNSSMAKEKYSITFDQNISRGIEEFIN